MFVEISRGESQEVGGELITKRRSGPIVVEY